MGTSTPTLRVIDLRPRALARRAGAQRELLVTRRRRVAPGHQRPLTVLTDVLDRATEVEARDLDAWERLLDLLAERDGGYAIPAAAAAANLFALGAFDDVLDHEALADLAHLLGHRRLARLQHRYGAALEQHPALPLTTRALRRLAAPDRIGRLVDDGCPLERARWIDDAALRAAHALLTQGLDHRWAVPLLDTPEEIADIVRNGTVVEWRHHMALLAADPWSAYATRLAGLAEQTCDAHTAAIIATLIDLCREQTTLSGPAPYRVIEGLRAIEGSTGAPAGVTARHLGGATQHG